MGAEGKSKYESIQLGEVFTKWTVIGSIYKEGPHNRYKLPCKCQCGVERGVDAHNLINGKSKGCIHCFNSNRVGKHNTTWKGYEEIPSSWLYRFKNYSKKRNDGFRVTLEYVWKLYLKQDKKCALSGLPLSFVNTRVSGRKHIGLKCSASLDRIDSNKGYTEDNVQLVHKDVNIMKNAFPEERFLEVCKLITEHNK